MKNTTKAFMIIGLLVVLVLISARSNIITKPIQNTIPKIPIVSQISYFQYMQYVPQNLFTIGGNKVIMLYWDYPVQNSTVVGFNIYRSTTTQTEVFYKSIGNINAYNDTVINNQIYFYKVSALLQNNYESVTTDESSAVALVNEQ